MVLDGRTYMHLQAPLGPVRALRSARAAIRQDCAIARAPLLARGGVCRGVGCARGESSSRWTALTASSRRPASELFRMTDARSPGASGPALSSTCRSCSRLLGYQERWTLCNLHLQEQSETEWRWRRLLSKLNGCANTFFASSEEFPCRETR